MDLGIPCHVEVQGSPHKFESKNALDIIYRVCDIPSHQVSITFNISVDQKVAIRYDLAEGTVDTVDVSPNKVLGVNIEYSFQTQPFKDAIALMAKVKLVEWLITNVAATDLNNIIQKNFHGITEKDVHNTLNQLLNQSSLSFFGSAQRSSEGLKAVREVLMECKKMGINIDSMNVVNKIQSEILIRLNPEKAPAPRPASSGG